MLDLSFSLTREFDFIFLSLGLTTPLITPVISIDSIGSFWGGGFDVLNSMKFESLVGLLSSSRQLDRV